MVILWIAAMVSIHAPTRGATSVQRSQQEMQRFQFTLPREERRASIVTELVGVQFQSTLPREERLPVANSLRAMMPRGSPREPASANRCTPAPLGDIPA